MIDQARIVIVGGGIMGAGLLYHLAEGGCTDAVMIEKAELTSGSTWHAAGQCPSFVGNYNLAKIHAYSNTLYPKLEELTGQAVGWHGTGSIRLALTKEEVDWFRYVQGFAANAGFGMEIIGLDEIKRLNPYVSTDDVIAGAWTPDDGHADPAGLCFAMAKGATNLGAKVIRHNRVTDIRALASGEWEVITEQGTIIAETVVNAAGCNARQVAQMVGADVPIINMEHHYLVTDPIKEFIESDYEIPVMRCPWSAGYLRQEQKAGLIGIYEHVGETQAWEPRGYPHWESESELFTGDLDRLMPWLERAMQRMPIWANAGIKRIVNGAIPHTPDGPPLLGPVAGLKNFWLCCGSSFGIAQGAGCGKYLAQWMLEGDSEINMTGMDPRRFGVYADDKFLRARIFQDYSRTFITPMPGEELPVARQCRTSPLYDKLKAKGAVYTETYGWERPKWYSLDGREEQYSYRHNNVFEVVRNECLAVRERVGVLDLSGFAKYDVSGPDAGAYLDRLCANRMPLKVGGVVLTQILSRNGRIAGEMTVTRFAENEYYVLSAATAEMRDLDHLQQGLEPNENVSVRNVTDQRGVLVVAGPRARDLLAQLTDTPLDSSSFRWLTAQEIAIAGRPVRTMRVNYVGELGWELHPHMEDMETIYDALWDAGGDLGVADFGIYAVNSMRMEKAYRGWGGELTNEVTLLDADMARFFRADVKEEFNGRAATLAQQEAGRSMQLVYFSFPGADSDVVGGEPLFDDEKCIGVTTSGGYGHFVGTGLGFGYVDLNHCTAGTVFDVVLLGERHCVTVLGEPAHDPSNERLRA